MKYFGKEEDSTIRSKLGGSLGFDQASDLELELELEQYSPKPKTGSQIFLPNNLNIVRSGRRGKILLISFLIVPIYSTELS